jgi:hypothetical protein
LLNLSNVCFGYSFDDVRDKIKKKSVYHIEYNSSKTAAIVNIDSGSATYVNFKTRRVTNILKNWPTVSEIWKTNNIAYLRGSCGTGCAQSIIFISPKTSIVCPVHEYRIENLSQDEPPDFYNNDPLVIDTNKKMYVCYDETDVIHVFRMPKHLLQTIRPPKGYYADEAVMHNDNLVITYRNAREKIREIIYPIGN